MALYNIRLQWPLLFNFPSVLWHCWLGDIRRVKSWVLVWWWRRFYWNFAYLIAPDVTTTPLPSPLAPIKLANPGSPGKMAVKMEKRELLFIKLPPVTTSQLTKPCSTTSRGPVEMKITSSTVNTSYNRRRLHSSSSSSSLIRPTRLITVGDRAFPVTGSRLWKSLPHVVTSAPTLAVFRNRLKTILFSRSLV